MKIDDAYKLLEQGHKIKLPEWKGCYWKLDANGDAVVYNNTEGAVVSVKDSEHTLQVMTRDDWITDRDNPEEFGESLSFSEALHCLKSGKMLSRLGWEGTMRVTANMLIPKIMYHKNIGGTWMLCGPYVVNDEDIFAEDWYIVD